MLSRVNGRPQGWAAIFAKRRKRRSKKLDILLVEDEPLIALQVDELLSGLRHSVIGVARGHRKALELAGAHAPDLAIVDVLLAEGCGVATAGQIRRRFDIPVMS